jgi:hypothetical protein
MTPLSEAIAEAQGGSAPEPEPEEAGVLQVPAGSILASVRARAAQLQAETTTDIPLPGYDGKLVGRYRAVSLPRLYGRNGQMHNPMGEDWGLGADALATGLEGLYGLDPQGELVPLYASGDPARYDDELAQALGVEAEHTARAVLVAVMGGGALGESRVWAHFMQYQNWLVAGTGEEVAELAVGEQAS